MKYKNITAKKGDSGFTDLCLGGRVSKTDSRIQVVGEIDLFHATMGLCHEFIRGSAIYEDFVSIQKDLTLLMGEICCDDFEKYYEKFGGITGEHVNKLDSILMLIAEELDSRGTKQSGWSYYGEKGPASARLDYAGTVCRKCEISILSLQGDYNIRSEICSYMNRLSKVLYLYARKFENA
jgi:ATP:cob(I)alamin adenosyltransferase